MEYETEDEGKTTGVHKADECNSTDFTDCCGVAVNDEKNCPICGTRIY